MNAVPTSRFGRTRGGRSPWPGALAIGAGLTALVTAAVVAVNQDDRPVVNGVVIAASTLPIFLALGWVILVDRRTLSDVPVNPEESIEGSWYDAATRGAFHDLLLVMGLGLLALSLLPALRDLRAMDVLMGIVVFAGADVGVRYAVARGREG